MIKNFWRRNILSEKKVAVVVPVYKDVLNDFEKISLAQVQKNFTQCPVLFVAPEGKKFSYIPFNKEIIYFPNEDFLNLLNHGKLLLGKSFYSKVFGYEDIFIYKLDSFSPADETELSLFRSYINCFENIFSELTKEVSPTENFSATKKSVASEDNFFAELGRKISSAKAKKSNSLRNNPAELKKFLLGVAIDRLNYRLENNLSLLRYIPKKFYPVIRIINLPYPKNVFENLSREKFFIGDEIFLYGAKDLSKLLQDLNQAKDKNNLIITTGIGDDAAIKSELKNFGIDVTEKFFFFNTEYINSCEKIFHNLGKTFSNEEEKISKPKSFDLSDLTTAVMTRQKECT